jgi:hypothetical protein
MTLDSILQEQEKMDLDDEFLNPVFQRQDETSWDHSNQQSLAEVIATEMTAGAISNSDNSDSDHSSLSMESSILRETKSQELQHVAKTFDQGHTGRLMSEISWDLERQEDFLSPVGKLKSDELRIRVPWSLPLVLSEMPPGSLPSNLVVLTGEHHVEATTCKRFIESRWGQLGLVLLNAVDSIFLDNPKSLSELLLKFYEKRRIPIQPYCKCSKVETASFGII